MGHDTLRYSSDPSQLIKLAREKGWSNDRIVRELMRGMTAADVRVYAKKWAAALGISPAEFVRLAGPRSTPRRGS